MIMGTSNLNLPIWKSSNLTNRVVAARARALKVSADIVKSVPITTPDADAVRLETTVNKMLSSGTIKSLEEAYELGGTNPHPTKAENEANLDRSGYTVINGTTFLKLSNTDNVEAIRMLYNAGLSISEIKSKLSALKVGDILVLKCGRVLKKFPKQDYNSLLDNYPSFRGYKEYITTLDDGVYAVCDTLIGNYSTFVLYVEQDNNDSAYLACPKCSFPINGSLGIVINNEEYSYNLNATSSEDLLFQLNAVGSPIEFSWDNGLTISHSSSFKIKESDVAVALGIKEALYELKENIQLGYGGGKIEKETTFFDTPFNISVQKAIASKSNSLHIYKQLIDAGLPKEVCDAFLNGDSLYESVQDRSDALKELLETNKHSTLVSVYSDDLFKAADVRVVGTNKQTIKKVINMPDADLEYLLRYREDITGIYAYESKEKIVAALLKQSENSSGGSYYTKKPVDSDIWKRNTANARTVDVYIEKSKTGNNEFVVDTWLTSAYEFLDGVVYYANMNVLQDEEWASGTYHTEETLGLNLATSVNWNTAYSFAHGLNAFIGIRSEIPDSFLSEFESDMLIIQAYLDAAFNTFNGLCSKLAAIINIINSSLGLKGNASVGLGLNMGSILQCSLNLDLSLNIPIYLPSLNDIILALIDKLQALIDALIDLERSILCPIQNLLDKYINTSNFTLPCKINYSVPVISGIEGYLSQYLYLLNQLRALCRISKKDSTWVKYNATMLPGSIELMVTDSDDCKES